MKTSKISFNHIKSIVPDAIKQKMLLIAELAKNEVINNCNTGEQVIQCETIKEIFGVEYSGFIPFQDGGFCASGYFHSGIDSSYHFTEKQTEYNNQQYENMIKDFCMDNELEFETLNYSELSAELQEKMCEYELDSFYDSLLSFEIFADSEKDRFYDKPSESIVTMRLSINYKDAPYYFEEGSEYIKQVIISYDEFLKMTEAEFIEQFKL